MKYIPTHLTSDEVRELYANSLKQAEAATLQAWVNYLRCKEAQEVVEKDLERLFPPVDTHARLNPAASECIPTCNGLLSPEMVVTEAY